MKTRMVRINTAVECVYAVEKYITNTVSIMDGTLIDVEPQWVNVEKFLNQARAESYAQQLSLLYQEPEVVKEFG